MYTNVRLDTTDYDHVLDVCQKYHSLHREVKYLLAKEVGDKTGKHHVQGWFYHEEPRKSFCQYIYNNFSDLKGGKRSVSKTKTRLGEYRYIMKNSKKQFDFNDCITNYSQEEYDEMLKEIDHLEPFVPKEEFFKDKQTKKHPTWWDSTIDILDTRCVYQGQILYSVIPRVYFRLPQTKRLSKALAKENLQGMIMELENRHVGNDRLHDEYLESIACDPLFAYSKEENDLFKLIS